MRMVNGYVGTAGLLALVAIFGVLATGALAQRTAKPVLHGRHWMAITGKPLAATAGAAIFQKNGNAVDAACAMIAATSTMWDTLGVGRRDAGPHLQPEDEEGDRRQRARRGARPARRPSSSSRRSSSTRRPTGRSRR